MKIAKQPREFNPFMFFGKSFSFDKSEQKIIRSLRSWLTENFAKHQMVSNQYITKLSDALNAGGKNENGKYYDFDL